MSPNNGSPPPGAPGSLGDPDSPRPDVGDLSTASLLGTERPAERIGPYRILQPIGEGGMGVVYLAEQERPIRRRVALKLVKLGMDTQQVVARFEAERQALALMDHPNIAKVFDAGATEQGRPFFVMEHVAGVRITDYCDRHRLSTKERLKLFVPVCQAIQHAHQKAIIHRDLKPSNLLVTVQDEKPVPKVIDFGVAKATAFRLTEQTVYTELGQMIGTPDYMSPEQAEMTGLNVDTRTDIYSLGVILYELLAGALPFDAANLRQEGFEGVRRIIREKEPPRPSTRVSRQGEAASQTAQRRRTTVPALRRQLRGELDWITMRALEKDRTRRYQTALELASDIGRYLSNEPVLASPPSTLYRLRKQAVRHKGPVAATVAVIVAIVTLGSVSLWQGQKARAEGLRARANAILASAAAAKDPVLKALLVRELDGMSGLTAAEFSKARSVLGAPLPVAAFGEEEPPWWTDAVTAAISLDGSRVAVASADATVRVWRTDAVGEPIVLRGHGRRGLVAELGLTSLYCVGFSPDGQRIVTCGWDRTACVWPASGGAPVVLKGHGAEVLRAEFDREGRRVVTASADGTARIWPADGVGEPIVLHGHTDEVHAASFSPDGSRVVTASLDGTVRVWRADGAGTAVALNGPEGRVTSVGFSPDGQRILASSEDGTARMWRADGTEGPFVFKGHAGQVWNAAFSPDGQRIVTASADHTARVWSADGTVEPAVLQGHQDGLWWAGFSPDGSRIMTASADGTARIWEPAVASRIGNVMQAVPAGPFRGRKIRFRAKVRVETDGGSGSAYLWLRVDLRARAGFSANMADRPITTSQWREYELVGDVAEDADIINVGMHLRGSGRAWMDAAHLEAVDGMTDRASGLLDGGFEARRLQWIVFRGRYYSEGGYRARPVEENPAEGKRCVLLESHPDLAYRSTQMASHGRGIRMASIAAGGKRVMTAASDGTARLWNTEGNAEPVVLKGHTGMLWSAAFSPDGQRIVTASADGTARIWRSDGTGEPVVLKGHEGPLTSAAFSPDGRRIVTTSADQATRLWRADGTAESVVLKGHDGTVNSAAFSPDGLRIVTSSSDGTARIWRADGTGQSVVLKGHGDDVVSALFSPDGLRVVTASTDGTARLWVADGTEEPLVLKGHAGQVWSAAFSPDGQRIVTASYDRTAMLWSADGTPEPVALKGHRDHVFSAAFSPDGRRVVTASRDGVAAVWESDGTGEPITLMGHEGILRSAAFSPDGQLVVTASDDGTARVWRVTWDGLFGYLRANVALCLRPEERMLYLGEPRAEAARRFADCELQHGRAPGNPEAPPS